MYWENITVFRRRERMGEKERREKRGERSQQEGGRQGSNEASEMAR